MKLSFIRIFFSLCVLCIVAFITVDIVLTHNKLALTANVSALFSIGAILFFFSTGAKKIPFAMFIISLVISLFVIKEKQVPFICDAILFGIFLCNIFH
ncbi:MAG: hypothetical protein J6I73_05990 [Treponema sp.]|nr:hypothetical protein [Treponema sp.]